MEQPTTDVPAQAKFSSAREELPSIHENFYSRVYAHTDPVIPAPKYEKRLRLLSAYRDFYHGFYADRNQSSAREFNPSHVMASGVDIRGGTLNLDNANDVLNKNDFVVLRAFLTPWEVRQRARSRVRRRSPNHSEADAHGSGAVRRPDRRQDH